VLSGPKELTGKLSGKMCSFQVLSSSNNFLSNVYVQPKFLPDFERKLVGLFEENFQQVFENSILCVAKNKFKIFVEKIVALCYLSDHERGTSGLLSKSFSMGFSQLHFTCPVERFQKK